MFTNTPILTFVETWEHGPLARDVIDTGEPPVPQEKKFGDMESFAYLCNYH